MTTPYVELKDKHGNNIYFGNFGDLLIPAFPVIQDFRQHKQDIREMEFKPDDVLIVGYLKTDWYGDWFDHVLDWEDVIKTQTKVPIFTSVFEDMKKDPVGQIEKLDQFLGTNRGRQLCERIADACSFIKMKEVKEIPPEIKKKLFKENASFYRKGEVGDWKNWFTVEQNELFDEVYKKRMAGSSLRYTFVQ